MRHKRKALHKKQFMPGGVFSLAGLLKASPSPARKLPNKVRPGCLASTWYDFIALSKLGARIG